MNVWNQLLARIEQTIDRTDYETWFAPTRFLARRGDTIDVGIPTQKHVDIVRERFGPQVRELLNELSRERVQVHFVIENSEDDLPQLSAPPQREELVSSTFNPRYSFSTFVVGSSNQLAYAASLSIAENPSTLSGIWLWQVRQSCPFGTSCGVPDASFTPFGTASASV